MTLLAIASLVAVSRVEAADTIELTPTDEHHVIELNSNQPYVAGYHVNSPDLNVLESVPATAITVSFPSTDSSYFPSDSWLGAGMFVQAQDYRFKHVDYAFYTMFVLDSSGGFFVDLGLHQTRESTAPIQTPTESLLYAYTWQILGIDPATPVTLLARWDTEGFVHYSLSTDGANISIASINVAALPNNDSIIRRFFAGTYIAGTAFPLGHYAYYFQFGVVSSKIIADNHWSARLKEPKILRQTGWQLVETAWTTQGDIAYLDYDWMWGGAPYNGVSAQYQRNPLENPYEVIFSFTGKTLSPGTILWQSQSLQFSSSAAVSPTFHGEIFRIGRKPFLLIELIVALGLWIGEAAPFRSRKEIKERQR